MPLPPRTKKKLPTEAEEYVGSPPEGIRIGIALSGGGIRSAAFNLGALQALQETLLLPNAAYLAAVSGGNYIASALTISAAHLDPDCQNGKPLWGRGSPEERYLRQHTDYLAPGLVGKLWMAASGVYGLVLNYLPFALVSVLIGRLLGWGLFLLGVRPSDLRLGGFSQPGSVVVIVLTCLGAGMVTMALLLVVYRRWFKDGHPGDYGESKAEKIAMYLFSATGLIGVCLILPKLAELYGLVSAKALATVFADGEGAFESVGGRLLIASAWLLLTLVVAVVALALGRRFRALRVMLVLASLAGAGLMLIPLFSSLDYVTRHGVSSTADVLWLVVPAVVVLVMGVTVHNRRYSMHLFYRERLNSAFALKRRNDGGRVQAEPIRFDKKLYFSGLGGTHSAIRLPKLVVCCAVNLTNHDVPVGRFAESFTFEHDVTGGPILGYRNTEEFENADGVAGTQLTLPSIMAVSGAAVSPLMGRFTYPPLRFLMALTNVRLGVWIKNPLHRSWQPDNATPEGGTGGIRRAITWIRDGWREPGALYVLREALGAAKSTHRYIYLTDGGHWENLGLVELLRRQCTHVVCFDASCDRTSQGLDIGRAIAFARSELRADVELDPRPVMADAEGFAEAMTVDGTVRYPAPGSTAKLVYAKAVLTEDASWDLHAYKKRDNRFPNHSTTQQMFTDEQFEAYRTLGHEAGLRAAEQLNVPKTMLTAPITQEEDATRNGQTAGGEHPAASSST
jgi:hypothetical protein